MTQRFVKLTAENKTGFWYWLRKWLVIDPNRSSGLTLNNQFRKPAPGTPDKVYTAPSNLPASDIAENPYWKRDTRRNYPRLGVITQSTLAERLLLGRPLETTQEPVAPVATPSLSAALQSAALPTVQTMVLTKEGTAPLPGKPYHWVLDPHGGYPSLRK
ncbi:hypothetical protein PORY_001237 [Pneumocystis oryctolagi]|uniref:Uncharacterized protein n=1 Tax=Pneumocystis oryctolagi TaxID=42067 RepID=A0ACB7CF01_9ASCO|nr:hypothetical protein PORY_001237 [Pneumocystis oryctolagi]